MKDIKTEIFSELRKEIPNLNYFQKTEVLNHFSTVLTTLLEKEKAEFKKKLTIKDSDLEFDIFQENSNLSYLYGILQHIDNVCGTDQTREIINDFEPKYIDFGNEIAYSKRYYEMLKICELKGLANADQKKIISDAIKGYQVRGINLDSKKQTRLKEIGKKLSDLRRKFSKNVLLGEEELSYHISDLHDLSEMPEELLLMAKKVADQEGKDGYVFGSSISEYIGLMKYCSNKEHRKAIYEARNKVASFGQFDNREIIVEILELRQEKSEILGFKNYAELSLYFKMAGSPDEVYALIGEIVKRSQLKAKTELDILKMYFGLNSIDVEDVAYYFRKYKEEKFEIHEAELKQYFEYHDTLEAMFEIMGSLYGINIRELKKHSDPDKKYYVYEVLRKGKLMSYFIIDPFFRSEKRSGAWATNLKEKFNGSIPVVVNVYNISKGEKYTLLKLREVETMFHEFGHAMHEMFSDSEYSELSGLNVELDLVELPSQFHEHFCTDSESMKRYAKHYLTGDKITDDLVEKLQEVTTLDTGTMVLNQCVYALLDMSLHAGVHIKSTKELDTFIIDLINDVSVIKRPKDYKMYTSFSHIFDGGYAGGYYSYMWSEILELDVRGEFKKAGIFNTEIANKLFDTILSQGSRKDGKELFLDFSGRDMSVDGFCEAKGF